MRRLVLLLTLMGGSVLFFGVAAPAANAANCMYPQAGNASNGAGYVHNNVYVNGCSADVDKVRFKYQVCDVYTCTAGNYTYYSGWYDYWIYGAWAWGYLDHIGGNFDQTKNVSAGGASTQVIRQCWWGGGFTNAIVPHFWWQIHNSSGGGSWGSYHETVYPGTFYVAC